MKKHYATHVEDTDKLISVAGPILEYETWYEQYKKLMEEQAQRKYGLYTPTSEGGDDFDPSSFDQAWTVTCKTNEDSDRATIANITGNGNDLTLTNFGFAEGSGYGLYAENYNKWYQVSARGDFIVTADKINITAVKETTSTLDFVMDKEFTIVGEWKLVADEMGSAGIVKPSSLFVFNKDNGLIIYINNTSKGQVLNTKSLKAICSDGRVYSDDWSEMLVSEEQPIASSNKYLMIGSNGNHFTKIALKNLAIYNHILSKDDCIKAYDYLQTLKAK